MPSTRPPSAANFLHRRHHRRKLGDGAAAQIIAVGEAAGQNDGIDIAECVRIVPDEFGLLAEIVRDGVPSIVIAIAAGKDDDAEFHEFCGGLSSILAGWVGFRLHHFRLNV